MSEGDNHRTVVARLRERLAAISWRDFLLVGLPLLLAAGAVAVGVALLQPAPPGVIRLLSGPEGSSYRSIALRYKQIIEPFGVKVEVIPTRGALDNLQRLANRSVRADVGFVQGGLTDGVDISRLVSLGSLFPQPLLVYHRQSRRIELLSELRGKRLAVGPEGSGTHATALKVLQANEMDHRPTVLLTLGGDDAARALMAGTIDAVFLSSESATPEVMRKLHDTPGIDMVNFRQATGYARKFRFLSRLTLPEGALDLGRNYPPQSYDLIGPTVELVARDNLHPALSDLLIGAAREVHGGPGLFRDAGEFPAPLRREFPISADAERYYQSGGHFLYRRLPFWLASLLDRLLVIVLPLLVVIVPASRIAPPIYRWRVRSRVYRWYGRLMAIDREMSTANDEASRARHEEQLDALERAVNAMHTPVAYADQVYLLRQHVRMVRDRLQGR